MKKVFPLLLLAMTMLCACSSDESVEETVSMSATIENFLCEKAPTVVSADKFAKYAVGYAWKNIAEYDVDATTGKVKDYDKWGRDGKLDDNHRPIGASPVHLAFGNDVLTSYFYYDAHLCDAYTETAYTFDDKGLHYYDMASRSSILKCRIVSLDEEKMVMLRYAGVKLDNTPVYTYITYERLTQEDRDEMVKRYIHKL